MVKFLFPTHHKRKEYLNTITNINIQSPSDTTRVISILFKNSVLISAILDATAIFVWVSAISYHVFHVFHVFFDYHYHYRYYYIIVNGVDKISANWSTLGCPGFGFCLSKYDVTFDCFYLQPHLEVRQKLGGESPSHIRRKNPIELNRNGFQTDILLPEIIGTLGTQFVLLEFQPKYCKSVTR